MKLKVLYDIQVSKDVIEGFFNMSMQKGLLSDSFSFEIGPIEDGHLVVNISSLALKDFHSAGMICEIIHSDLYNPSK